MFQNKNEENWLRARTAAALSLTIVLLLSVAAMSSHQRIMGEESSFFLPYANAAVAVQEGPCNDTLQISKITASASSTRSPHNAVDNNWSTRWTSNGQGSWIKPYLGEQQKTVCHVDVAWYKGNGRVYDFSISVSSDGSSWNKVYAGKSSGKTTSFERYNFNDINARWVKITVNGNQWNMYNDITELKVYGHDADISPSPAPTGSKYFFATMLQYVNTDTLVNIYKPNMIDTDKSKIHVGLNKDVTTTQLNGLKSLLGAHGLEFFSLAEIKANAPKMKSMGMEFIAYDLEPGDGHSPSTDLADPVASIKAASNAAHDNGLLLQCAPSKALTSQYGTQFAPYCDQYHIQAQALQGTPSSYQSFVEEMVTKLRSANPKILISVQLSASRESATGMTLLETMERDFSLVADKVNGVSVWYSSGTVDTLEAFTKWYDQNYRQ